MEDNIQIDIKKLKKSHRSFFKRKIVNYVLVSVISSLATFLIFILIIVANKNIILDKIFQLRNEQISAMINNEIAKDYTLVEAEKLLENNSNQEKLKQEEVKKTENSPKSIVDIVRTANPAVVSISLYKDVPSYEFVLNQETKQLEQKEIGKERKNVGSGSGFLISADGVIVTNRHVVDMTGVSFEAIFNNGNSEKVEVLAIDPVYDVAIMKISSPNKKYAYLELGDSDTLNVGESVLAIGNALGELKNSVSVGIISGLSRSLNANGRSGLTERLEKVIQTDAAINKGNSGGPLINLYGKVIGVNVAIAESSQSVGFALPINSIKDIISSVKKTGKIARPFVGVRYVVITPEIKAKQNLPTASGIWITNGGDPLVTPVIPGSPAEKAGLMEGDIITEADGKKITQNEDFAFIIRNKKVGDTISMQILRGTVVKNISLVLGQAK